MPKTQPALTISDSSAPQPVTNPSIKLKSALLKQINSQKRDTQAARPNSISSFANSGSFADSSPLDSNSAQNHPAQQLLQMPKKEVGAYALDLAQLAVDNIPLPRTYCLPVATLKTIAQANQLSKQFKQITQNLSADDPDQIQRAKTKISRLILNQAIPEEVSQKLFEIYDLYLDKDFIRLTASPVSSNQTQYKREDNIRGEANMIESILKLWSRNLEPSHLLKQQLFPVAIVIQSQIQPTAAGVAFSQNPTDGDKSKILIKAVHGVFDYPNTAEAETFLVDQRDWEIEQRQPSNQSTLLTRKMDRLQEKPLPAELEQRPTLTDKQAQTLAQLVRKLKLNYLYQIRVHWNLTEDKLLITKIKPFHFQSAATTNQLKTLLIGQTVTNGYLDGVCQLINSAQQVEQFDPGKIAVVDQLTLDHQYLIQTASGIICQNGIKHPQLLSKIRKYQLPTIVYAQHALRRLKNGQQIILDAGGGKVYQDTTGNRHDDLDQSTHTQVWLAVNQPRELNSQQLSLTAGLGLIRSEHFFIQTGHHPRVSIHNNPDEIKQQISHQIVSFYHRYLNQQGESPLIVYRSQNLTTNQLLQLEQGPTFETKEQNPLVGFRGGIRQLNQPDIFEFELDTLAYINRKLDKQLVLMLPFVRTAFELNQIIKKIKQQLPKTVTRPQIWLQINTPENLFNLEEYLQQDIAGVGFNLRTLHGLYHGIDPDFPDIFNFYQFDNQLFKQELATALQKVKQCSKQITTNLILHDFNQELIQFAVENLIDGITVKPALARQTKQTIVLCEQEIE